MLFLNLTYNHLHRAMIVVCMALLLAGCPSLLHQDVSDDGSAPSSYYLEKANQTGGSAQVDYQILAARALLREGDIARSEQIVNSLPQDLTNNQLKEGFLLTGEIQVAKRNPKLAQLALSKLTVGSLSASQQARYYQIQIQSADRQDPLTKLRSFVALEQLVGGKTHQDVINASWDYLVSLPASTINGLAINSNEETLRGWLDLYAVYMINRNNLARLQGAIKQWQAQYPQNPYSVTLPARLAGIVGFEPIKVTNVALLLPLDGQAQVFSKAIEAGFRAGMNESNAYGVHLDVYDTTRQSVPLLMQQLEASGVHVIVGPLLKSEVNQAMNTQINLPVLTLNKPDSIRNIANMCYFALAPEDEAREAAAFISNNRHKLPLIIAPRNELGQRVARAFDGQWARQNGSGALVQYFDSVQDLKESMNHRTGIRLTGSPVVSGHIMPEGRVDAVYIFGNPEELNLIKAMIDMEIGNRVTSSSIYASSRSHFAGTGPDFRLEMDGIRFSDIPLLAGANGGVYQTAMRELGGDYSLVRLYAFGMDAWKLANSLAEMRQLPNYQVRGYTGTLTANNSCVINRKLSWLEYRQGSIAVVR